MKDIFNIVKVSDIDDIDCRKIIKKCFEKPTMINYFYPHIFMNRDKINKEELIKLFDEHILGIKRDKHLDHTIRKYNILTSILESLFLCVFDMDTIKNIQKFIQYNFSKDNNNIVEIVNHIIDNKVLSNLDQLLNDKIDNSHAVFIIEKVIEHIKKTYVNENLEKQTLTQLKLVGLIQSYILKFKFNPYVNKIIHYNKKDLINTYLKTCVINESHDLYIGNIIECYVDLKNNYYDNLELADDWNIYFSKVGTSLNIDDPKQKILKTLHRFTILNKIITITNETKNDKNLNVSYGINNIIEANKLNGLITNCYINMLKNNCSNDKLVSLEVVIKYFTNFSTLTKELIKLIIPKHFSKEPVKFYMEAVNRLNTITNKKLVVIDNIIDEQKKYQDDLKITYVDNASKSIFNKDIVSLYNIDHKYVDESLTSSSRVLKNVAELVGYDTFTNKWFDKYFSGYKKVTINEYLTNGKVQINNTIINTNLILLNVLFLFNNPYSTISSTLLEEHIDRDIINDVIYTLEYHKLIINNKQNFILNSSLFSIKQELKIDLIKKVEVKEAEVKIDTVNLTSELIECYILKAIKPAKVHKDSIYDIVAAKCKVEKDLFEKCMKRLFDLDYYTIEEDHLIYVP